MNDDYDTGEKQNIILKLLDGVTLNKLSIDIPSTNLNKNTWYNLKVTATISSTTISSTVSFYVRDEDKKKSLEDIITPDLISVVPDSGTSGTTTFTAQYTLDNGNANL